MTIDELRALYEEGKKIARDELVWRRKVFAQKPRLLRAKEAQMQRLLIILARLKDELKPHCEPTVADAGSTVAVGTGLEQPPLIDVPRKVEYR